VDKALTVADLSEDQAEVFDHLSRWAIGKWNPINESGSRRVLAIGGFAGSGKSTLLSVFASTTKLLVAYVAFTGRAASVLDRKLRACGVKTTTGLKRGKDDARRGYANLFDDTLGGDKNPALCTTIHRLLYRPVVDEKTEELRGFAKRSMLDRKYDLIVIDEASLVGDEMLEDLKVHGVPILAVGDHGQLPPVMSSGSCVANPDLQLEKIHRQALGNPIIKLSRGLRLHGELRDKYQDGDRVIFAPKAALHETLRNADLRSLSTGVLCWMNKTRITLNGAARKAAGFMGPPKKGEIVISLKNKPPVYNGMRGVLAEDAQVNKAEICGLTGLAEFEPGPKAWELYAKIAFPDEGLPASRHTLCAAQFNREKAFVDVEELRERGIDVRSMGMAGELYDFGYALTVHKSQGSSFEHAIVYCDRPQKPHEEDWRRWIYTAVTRASERVTVLL
jgi:exodeoxyribonuclease V